MAALRAAGAEFAGDDDLYFIRRLYPGSGQRSGGAWSWSLDYNEAHDRDVSIRAVAFNTGSQWPVTELLKDGLKIENHEIGYVVLPKWY
jgi:hypothetical protein